MFQRGLKVYEKTFGPEHPETAKALSCLLVHYMKVGDYSNAAPVCVRSLKIREKSLGPEHPETAEAWSRLGLLMLSLGGHKYAEPYFEKSLAISEKVYGPEHVQSETTLRNLIFLKIGLGKPWEAMGLARKYKAAAETAVFDILAFAPEHQLLRSQGPFSVRLISVLAAAGSPRVNAG
jgi:tetratricopeptide (TPR) repeat protein